MTTTPQMGLVLPTDHGSADVWDTILDAVFGVIDSHDHTTGKGAPVPVSALRVATDLSFGYGGTQRAITDLKAIDFSPQDASGMTALSGALFLNSADNELYWRNASGVLVKFTAGAALNVAAFTGGIGGDYSAAGALVVFDDATDSYWFQQQVGAGVRQYARMRSADLDLYEFKANPAAGVPTSRVRLASPSALAASYALTMPAALPASNQPLASNSAGVTSFGQSMALAANQDFTISGTGNYKHGIKSLSAPILSGNILPSGGSVSYTTNQPGFTIASGVTVYVALPAVPRQNRVVNVKLWFDSAASAANATCTIYESSTANPPTATLSSTGISLSAGGTAVAVANGANLYYSSPNSQTWFIRIVSTGTVTALATTQEFDVP